MRLAPAISLPRLFAATAAAATLFLAACSTQEGKPSERSAYALTIAKGAAPELDRRAFDPNLPGYWLVGREATIQLSRIQDEPLTKTFSLMLRTKPDATAAKPSEIDVLRISTPNYRIVTKFNPDKVAPVDIMAYSEKKEGTEFVVVKTDTTGRYLAFERVGEHVKVTFTAEAMSILGDDFVMTWEDRQPGRKVDPAAAAEAAARRVL